MNYLKYSDLAIRINLNPFGWNWKPWFGHDTPTDLFPKRHTYGFGWLFIQIFVDVDNGARDFSKLNEILMTAMDEIEVKDEQN